MSDQRVLSEGELRERVRQKRKALGATVFGFTLLEVMIATAILAMALASVFGSNVTAARRVAHSRFVTQAAMLGQCRMTQVEAWLRKNQLPQTDQRVDDPPEMGGSPCCEAPFSCEANVDKIELPSPPQVSADATNQLLNSAAGALSGSQFGANGVQGGASGAGAGGPLAGLMGALGGLGAPGGAAPGAGAMGSGSGAPDVRGVQGAVLSGIYPTLKPMLEGAIRRVKIKVAWHEGDREFSFELVQYVTSPGQTLQSGATMQGLPTDAINQLINQSGNNNTPTGPGIR